VAFAEVEKFLDTPVKHYSSGMYMRLAFSVAAHLEPEILLVDEVLAVGDGVFQRKCIGKMGDVAQKGLTVIFVSHNMRAIRQLCGRVLWLNNGELKGDCSSEQTIEKYLSDISWSDGSTELSTLIRRLPPDPAFRLESVILRQNGTPVVAVQNGQPLEVAIGYQVLQKTVGLRVFFDLYDREGTLLFRSFHDEQNDASPSMEPGRYLSTAIIPEELLAPTQYRIHVLATVYNVRMCIPFPGIRIPVDVEATGRANRAYPGEPIRGKLAPVIPWTTEACKAHPEASPLFAPPGTHP
jgi:lipopolysaccharide transport system ATP-binding protein